MKYFWNLCLILFIFFIQNSVVPYISILGIKPDFLLIFIVSLAFLEGPNYGSINGFFGGLLQDLLSIRGFGIGMISKTILGYGSGMIERTIFLENRVLVAPAIALASVVSNLLYIILAFLLGYQAKINFVNLVLTQALYNAVLGIPLFIVVERFWNLPNLNKSNEVEQRSREYHLPY